MPASFGSTTAVTSAKPPPGDRAVTVRHRMARGLMIGVWIGALLVGCGETRQRPADVVARFTTDFLAQRYAEACALMSPAAAKSTHEEAESAVTDAAGISALRRPGGPLRSQSAWVAFLDRVRQETTTCPGSLKVLAIEMGTARDLLPKRLAQEGTVISHGDAMLVAPRQDPTTPDWGLSPHNATWQIEVFNLLSPPPAPAA